MRRSCAWQLSTQQHHHHTINPQHLQHHQHNAVAFFGFGVLSKDDFNGFLWNVVMLAMGGLALGEAVKSSGLLLAIAQVRSVWALCFF